MVKSKTRRVTITGTALLLCLGLVTAGTSIVGAGAATKKVPGVTAHQITIGATEPVTGIASSGYNQVAKAANAVFKYVNKRGGIYGRTIKYVIKDDCYGTPGFGCTGVPNTATQTHALLGIPVFATVASLGTPTQDSVRALLKGDGVPQLYVASGSQDWNNAHQYPGLFGWQPSYNEESKIFAKYLTATYPNGSVCFLGQGDDFGTDGLAGLIAGGITPTAESLYSVDALVASNGASIAPYIQQFQSDKCTIDAPFVGKVPTDPEIGAISFSYLPTTTTSSPWIPWIYKVIEADPADFPGFTSTSVLNGNIAYGAAVGVAFVEALKANGKNLTRASFLKTLQSVTFSQTPSLVPLRYTASDHQGLNGGYITTVTSDSAMKPLTGTVYTTDSSTTGPVTVAKTLSSGIPAWLK
jgi:ABC-type branched-subunit amino acid transport system substrate-binding protein